jgi:hypothetical protein
LLPDPIHHGDYRALKTPEGTRAAVGQDGFQHQSTPNASVA